jgi:acyl-CoA synthetase (AMP-forming)/AMP-acid ligase II
VGLAGAPGDFMRTGDLGVRVDGGLAIAGRRKDLIIASGVNYHPHDLEDAAQRATPRARPGCGAAFGLDRADLEFSVLVQEVLVEEPDEDLAQVADDLRRGVAEEQGLILDGIFVVPLRAVPKTSSGKLQRQACREALLSGRLPVLYSSMLARLGAAMGSGHLTAPGSGHLTAPRQDPEMAAVT